MQADLQIARISIGDRAPTNGTRTTRPIIRTPTRAGLPAEVLYDAVFKVTGCDARIPGMKPGTRAAQLPDSGVDLPSGFLATLGRPPRESACECERSNDIRLGSVMSLFSGPTVSDAIDDPNNAIAKLVAAQPDDKKLVNEIYMRVLNRPATEAEIAAAVKMNGTIDGEAHTMTADLVAMEAKYKPIIAEQERARLEAIEKAKTELTTYEKGLAPKLADDERKRLERVAADEKAIKALELKQPERQAKWERELSSTTEWSALDAKEIKTKGGAKTVKKEDQSILVSGPNPEDSEYTIIAEVPFGGITGIKLEVLTDTSLPGNGPGRANNGNFVLNEFKTEWMKKGEKTFANEKFKDAKADYSQNSFNTKDATLGKADKNKGWAIDGGQGKTHQAAFAFEKAVGDDKGTTLKITMIQKYGQEHSIGRFRLSATRSAKPLELGIPAQISTILQVFADERTRDQQDALNAYYHSLDPELVKLEASLANNKKPLPTDPHLVELRSVLSKSEEPIVIEPKLIQLRADVAMSTKQLNDKRLTGAQDLVWALINNPAFLFNH